MFDDDDIKEQRAIIKAATPPGPFVKGPRYALCRGEAEYRLDGELCDVLTEEQGAPLYEAVPLADADFVIEASVKWPAALDEIERLRHRLAEGAFEATTEPKPVPMLLWCPECGERHIDTVFATRVHHTHSCQHCGHTWRPAVVPTVGVQFLPGFKDEPASAPAFTCEPLCERHECAIADCNTTHHHGLADLALEQGWTFWPRIGWVCSAHPDLVRSWKAARHAG